LKIIDFGCASEVSKYSRNTEMAGTPFYLAPEMLLGAVARTNSVVLATKDFQFTSKKPVGIELCAGDMWSVGVIVFFMLTGNLPFDGSTRSAVYQAICQGQYKFPEHVSLSSNAKDFISKLLVVNWQDRLTCNEAIEHPWLKENGASNVEFRGKYFADLQMVQKQTEISLPDI
jgi:serine/threonine protein kinase